MSVIDRDIFGKELYPGAVVFISRPGKYNKNFEIYILTEIIRKEDNKGPWGPYGRFKLWGPSWNGKSGKKSWTDMAAKNGHNQNIMIVEDVNNDFVKTKLNSIVVKEGIRKKLLPEGYTLGQNVDSPEIIMEDYDFFGTLSEEKSEGSLLR